MNFTERHFSVSSLARILDLSLAKVRNMLRGEPGVCEIYNKKLNKRKHIHRIVPESVAHRIFGHFEVEPLPDRLRLSPEEYKRKLLRDRREKRLKRIHREGI
jgi:predicted transcriptional regulator